MRKSFAEIEIVFPKESDQDTIKNIEFDKFGNYLLVSQENKIRVYSGKQWQNHLTQL